MSAKPIVAATDGSEESLRAAEWAARPRALVGLSARADLVVLGRRSAHHGPASVMHAVLSHAHGPVVTVPS